MQARNFALVLLSAGVLAGVGCKKKPKENKAPDPGSGTAMAGTGAGTGAGTAEPPKEAKLEGKAMADRYFECTGLINEQKWDDVKAKCIAKDYKGHEADGQDIASADAVIDWFKGQFAAFPDTKMQPQLVMVNGRNILAVGLITGTHTGTLKTPMGELPATNKKIGQLLFHRLSIDDENRVKEEWSYFDPATMMSQLGLMPKEAPKMRAALEKGWEGAPVVVVTADDETEKKNLEVIANANKAFMGKKPAEYMAFYADDALESDQAGDKDAKGKKEIEAGATVFLKAFPDIKLENPDVFAAGDYVITQGTFSGTNSGPLGPMKATNKPVKGQYAEVFKLKDGKIAEVWRFRNGMAMMAQLGMMPEPGKAGDAPKDEKKEEKKNDAKKSG